MSFLHRKIMAAFASRRQMKHTMNTEMEDCANYESFCCDISTSKKSRYSPDLLSDSDSDVSECDSAGNESLDDDTGWTTDEQSFQEETMDEDDFEVVFEEQPNKDQMQQNVIIWEDPCESINENKGSKIKITEENNSNIDWSNDEQSSLVGINDESKIFLEQSKRRTILQKMNKDWNECYKVISEDERTKTKVTFASDASLVEVLPADICDRKGEWMMYAVDRMRFEKRIQETEAILAPYLSKENRSKVSFRLQIDVDQMCSDSK